MKGLTSGERMNQKVPLAPLMTALVRRGVLEPGDDSHTNLAAAIGLSRQSTGDIVRRGELTVYAADSAAVRALNVHPYDIWGHEWLNDDAYRAGLRTALVDAAFDLLRQEVAS